MPLLIAVVAVGLCVCADRTSHRWVEWSITALLAGYVAALAVAVL